MTSSEHIQTLGCLAIAGPDSARFLQGQCTADAVSLPIQHWTLAGFANVKGRLYANGRLVRLAEDQFWFLLPHGNVASTLAQLSKYAAFFKTTLTDVSAQWQASPQPNPEGELFTVSQTATEVTLHCPEHRQLVLSSAVQAPVFDEAQWADYEMQQGLVWITPKLVAEFLPQEIEWDHLGGVSYQKGCYTGQEVIARLHYRGQLKKGLRHLSGLGQAPEVLAQLQDSNGKPRAQIARVNTRADGWQALAVVHQATDTLLWQDQPITLGDWVRPQSDSAN